MNTSAVLIGVAVGDSLGLQFETKKWNDPAILAWDGFSYGSSDFLKLEAGAISDDSYMTIALAESLIEQKWFDPENIAQKYLAWYNSTQFIGAGATTRIALQRLRDGKKWYESGEVGSLGCGSAMRISPIGVIFRQNQPLLMKYAKLDAIITHDSHDAQMGSISIATGVAALLNGLDKNEAFSFMKKHLEPSRVLNNLNIIHSHDMIRATLDNKDYNKELDRNGGNRIISQLILGNKYSVHEVVATSWYVFLATRNFSEAMELAVRAAGDSDSRASMVGALCGAYYGLNGIDCSLIDGLKNKELILKLNERLQ